MPLQTYTHYYVTSPFPAQKISLLHCILLDVTPEMITFLIPIFEQKVSLNNCVFSKKLKEESIPGATKVMTEIW